MELGFTAVPAITVIAFLICEVFKFFFKTEEVKRLLPSIAGLTGLVLGVLAFFISPELIPATDVFSAAAVGIASGFAATGIQQVYKQLNK